MEEIKKIENILKYLKNQLESIDKSTLRDYAEFIKESEEEGDNEPDFKEFIKTADIWAIKDLLNSLLAINII